MLAHANFFRDAAYDALRLPVTTGKIALGAAVRGRDSCLPQTRPYVPLRQFQEQ
jgi:hypothetical protein